MAGPESVMDFNKICRLCLTEESFMSSIYNDRDIHSSAVPLSLRIMACVSIEVNSVDGLPSHICATCLCQVDGWYKFKNLCETADAVLKKFIKNEPIQIETISQIRNKAQEIRKLFGSPHLVKIKNLDSAIDEISSAGKPVEDANFENCQREGLKFYSMLDLGSKTEESTTGISMSAKNELRDSIYVKSESIEKNKTKKIYNYDIENDLVENDALEDLDGDFELEEEEDHLMQNANYSSKTMDFSSDDDLSLSAKKEMILQEKNRNQKMKSKKHGSPKRPVKDCVRYLRTIKLQTKWCENEDEDDMDDLEVIETEMERNVEKLLVDRKKFKSRKTQTPKGSKSEGKKRFRIRPAVPSSCTLCDKVYKNSEILRQHMKSHHVTGTIECSSCKLTFSSLRSLKYHEQRRHSNLEPVPCTFCGKKFLDKKYLRIHENIHSQANHFVCQFCGRKFIMKTNLTVHISRHHTQKSNDFICQICGKAFPFKLYLKKHFKTHTDHKPYQCSHCEAKFRENTLLQKHVNSIHLKLRPFLCQYCHKTFTRSLYLREHMESQHMGIQKKMECSKCKRNFQNRNRLRQHECLASV